MQPRGRRARQLRSEEKEEGISFHDNLDFILEEFVDVLEDNLDIDLILSAARNI